jgi:hypothetical protein
VLSPESGILDKRNRLFIVAQKSIHETCEDFVKLPPRLVRHLPEMKVRGNAQDGVDALISVVRYAVTRWIAWVEPEYVNYATLIELAVLARDETTARSDFAAARARAEFES